MFIYIYINMVESLPLPERNNNPLARLALSWQQQEHHHMMNYIHGSKLVMSVYWLIFDIILIWLSGG